MLDGLEVSSPTGERERQSGADAAEGLLRSTAAWKPVQGQCFCTRYGTDWGKRGVDSRQKDRVQYGALAGNLANGDICSLSGLILRPTSDVAARLVS